MVKLSENAGFGFDKIDNNWLAYNNTKPIYDIEFDSVVLKMQIEKTVEKTVEKLLNIMKENPTVTTKALENEIGLSRRGIEWNIKKLKEQGKIRRIGPAKGGHWEIISPNKK